MAARNQAEPAAFASDAASGAALPLLPTLLVAVAVAALSFVCREPAAPVKPASAIAQPEPAAAPVAPEPAFTPASVAFSVQFPMIAAARFEPQRRHASPRVAATAPSLRRPEPTRAAPARIATQAAPPAPLAGAEDDLLQTLALPSLALPFAPTIRAVTQARDFIGAQGAAAGADAAALGDAVAGFVGRLR